MSKVISLVKKHFGYNNGFTPNELSMFTDIPQKVLSMVLKKYSNIELLSYSPSIDVFSLRTPEEVIEERIRANELIDKYNLQNKKYIIKKDSNN